MASAFGLFKRLYTVLNPPEAPVLPESTPIRFGILGAAAIAPSALITPAKSHAEAVVYAVAARDLERAQAFAKKHGIEVVYGGPDAYQHLLDDPNVDAVYNPLPNGLHYEWTMKVLAAGKHVLLEKPSANTPEETKQMFDLAEEKGLVLLEAFHYRFHPAIHRVKQILDEKELGAIKSIDLLFSIPKGLMKDGDIRFDFSLGGGSTMDLGCYALNCLRFITSSEPTSVLTASATPLESDARIDVGMSATLEFPAECIASIQLSLAAPPRFGFIPRFPQCHFTVVGEKGELTCFLFVMPTLYHYIYVVTKDGKTTKKRTEKVYSPKDLKTGQVKGWKGEDWWITYRYQLEAFIDKLKGREPATWVSAEDSIANMKAIEMVYEKAGLPVRPPSTFKLEMS